MLKNYFLIATRSFKKDKANALISLSSLIIGLTCVMLIVGYIHYETSFDTSYSNSSRIYQVTNNLKEETDVLKSATVPEQLAPTLAREIPEIQAQTSLDYRPLSFINSRHDIQTINYLSVDSGFFSMFNFKFIYGNAAHAFKNEHSLVLSEQAAQNIFGKKISVGEILYTSDSVAYTVTGIIQNIPKNTFFKAQVFINHPTSQKVLNYMGYSGSNACIMLGKHNSIQQVEKHLSTLYKKYKFGGSTLNFIPVQKLHLYSADTKEFPDNYNIGDIRYIYIYGSIALLILLIGNANFINLTIARSFERMKEVGVRKVLGASKKQLIFQFIGESSLYFVIAFPVSIILAVSCWHLFTGLLNINATVFFMLNIWSLLVFMGICFASSLLCSLYPAFFLSKLNPASTLKGNSFNNLKLNLQLRKILIVVQFSISAILIITTVIIHTQLNYLNNRNLGFNKSNLIVLNWNDYGHKETAFKNELLRSSDVQAVSFSRMNIAKSYGQTSSSLDPVDSTKTLHVATIYADAALIKTLQIPIIEGAEYAHTYLSKLSKIDSTPSKGSLPPMLLSKALIKALNISDPIGKVEKHSLIEGEIIGVIDDFKGVTLKEKNPLVCIQISDSPIQYGYGYIKISGTNTQSTIAFIKKKWKQFFPKSSFDFSFVDDRITHLYDMEIRLTKLFNIFALLAILISCAGLFSLVSLVVRKRTKEIGIRKVMGASVKDIVLLISKDFLRLIIISFFIAAPLAYIAINKWLSGYANKTKVYWWVFAIAGFSVFIIAFVAIGIKSIRAAKANPVESLKTE